MIEAIKAKVGSEIDRAVGIARSPHVQRLALGIGMMGVGGAIGLAGTGEAYFYDASIAITAAAHNQPPEEVALLNRLTLEDFGAGFVIGGGLFIWGGNVASAAWRDLQAGPEAPPELPVQPEQPDQLQFPGMPEVPPEQQQPPVKPQ